MHAARWARSISAALVITVAASGVGHAQSNRDLRAEAFRLYAAGQYRESLPYFEELLRRKPRDIEARHKRGAAYLRLNQPKAALADFDAVIRINPLFEGLYATNPESYTNRGIALVMLQRDGEALLAFERAVALRGALLKSDRAGLCADYCGIGQVYHRRGDDARALDAFDRAIRTEPSDPNGFVGRGLALTGMGMPDTALSSFDQAIQINPKHPRAYGYRALAYERLGRDDDALKDYDSMIRIDPSVAMTRRLKGSLLSRRGRNHEAIAELDAAIKLDPKDAGAFKDRGGVYNRLGDYSHALLDLDEALRLEPAFAKAYQNRAASYNGLGRHQLAARDCDRAVELDPKCAGAFNNRGIALAALKEHDRALADFDDALKLDSKLVSAYVNRADLLLHLGRIDEAVSDYESVARLEPDLAKRLPGLAKLQELQNRRPPSKPDDALAIRDALTQAAVEFDRANAKRAAGDWASAIAGYSRALESDPNHADALAFRGWSRLCAEESGGDGDARRALDLKGWRDPLAPYLALLGYLAARRDGHAEAADTFLAEALANTRPPDWPAPVFRYLRHTLPASQLMDSSDDANKRTEARTVIGLDLLFRGERTAAEEHLRWVTDHGANGSIAKDVARETLRRQALLVANGSHAIPAGTTGEGTKAPATETPKD